MRLQLHLTPSTRPVPFDHLHHLTGALHKWLGPNDLHDNLSLYSFGWLRGGKPDAGNLHFANKTIWNLSFSSAEVVKRVIGGLMETPEVAFGMKVDEVRLLHPPDFGTRHSFRTDGSMVVVRRTREDNTREYLLWDNPLADQGLTALLQKKLQAAGFSGRHLDVSATFDRRYAAARTRKITIKNTQHRGSECPVVVEGTPEALQFAWLVGIGELTGSGFGGLS